jgi:hypothetical protein
VAPGAAPRRLIDAYAQKLAKMGSPVSGPSFPLSVGGGGSLDAAGELVGSLKLGDLLAHVAPRPVQEARDFRSAFSA